MPYHLKHVAKRGWYVVDEDGKQRNKKPYPTKEAAAPFLRALYWAHGKSKKKK